MSVDPTVRYRFGPLERRGLVAGWRGGQIASVAAGLVVGVAALRSVPSPGGPAVAFVALAVGVGVATWPIAGRTSEEWAPDAVRHAAAVAGRRRPNRRSPFAALHLLPVDLGSSGGRTVGVLHDDVRRTYSVALEVSAPGFVLSSDEDKARRVAAWAEVLGALARDGTSVHRVQWIECAVAAQPASAPTLTPALAPTSTPVPTSAPALSPTVVAHLEARASYDALVHAESGAAWHHDVHLAVTVHAGRAARAVKAAGGGAGGACAVLLSQVAALRRRLADAGVEVGGLLDPGALDALVRRSCRPVADTGAPAPAAAGRRASWPWPMAVEATWGSLRADGLWHATFWVSEWPRVDVGPDFLTPFVLSSDVHRSLSVVMEPLGPLAAARKVERARTADIADAELRRRGGFLATARRRREEEVLARRELELADGHAQFRFSGYVTVSAPDPDELEIACSRTEQAAGRAGLELRRCYGDQLHAFLCTLPLGRGLA